MQLPSGVCYDMDDLNIIAGMAKFGLVSYGEKSFELFSGAHSHLYIGCREDLTDHPDLEYVIGRKIARTIYSYVHFEDRRQQCLIGVPTVGATLAQAGAIGSLFENRGGEWNGGKQPIAHRVLRKELKKHGAHSTWVDGKPNIAYQRPWFVDNTATSGQSVLNALDKIGADGYPVEQTSCLLLIDREQGALPRLKNARFELVVAVYNLTDILAAFGKMNLWPKDKVAAATEEIRANQISA